VCYYSVIIVVNHLLSINSLLLLIQVDLLRNSSLYFPNCILFGCSSTTIPSSTSRLLLYSLFSPLCITLSTNLFPHIMPYNTRRKSLSLPSLGIHLPNSSRRSPSTSKPAHATDDQLPPSKKVKRSHDSASSSPEPSPSSTSSADAKGQRTIRPNGRRGIYEHTPPPSPTDGAVAPKIDTEGINDDIVVGVIEQLEKTGNRPHLVKELAAVLISLNENVAKYAVPFRSKPSCA
jgi:hypothetical protein